jgi:hypothetical protein
VLSKVIEGFVLNWLGPIVMPYIDPYQFGNVKRSSTTHALVHLVHYWLSALEKPNTLIRTCLIDFSKDLDRIDHVPPVLLNWCVRVSCKTDSNELNCKTNWKTISAGVPQGTKLGPLFFLVMVNDLKIQLPLYKYVDDCALPEVVIVDKSESLIPQHEVDNVNQWSTTSNMKLNVKKTK